MKKYEYIQIGIASPEEILSWSYGEVKKHETINYRTLKPEKDGLFCEAIFGPEKSYQCSCGKIRRTSEKGMVCDKCGVELTESQVRRERMGHIKLASPVVHTWFFKNSPSKIAVLLGKKNKEIESLIYFTSYIITDKGNVAELEVGQILSEQRNAELERQHGYFAFKSLTGAEAIRKLLQELDLKKLSKELREELKEATKQRKIKLIKRLEVVEAFLHSDNKPEWMVMDVIPVIPPDLRPMVQLDGGRFAVGGLNELYNRILNRNIRLKKQQEQQLPFILIRNEKRILQQAVDALIDSSKIAKKPTSGKNVPSKSLSDLLRGKQGRFRQNLLGKRVDYSGRSVIAVGPDLQMYQCGIPREMALILYKPFIVNSLIKRYDSLVEVGVGKVTLKKAKEMVDNAHPDAVEEMEKIIVEHPVLLNRAPTLHRLGIQAFEPKLVEGKAIRLHPLVCPPFNADFDGDQMAVHLPLSMEARAEARLLMLASKNILAPKDGKPIVTPSQDMVLGNYYLTIEDGDDKNNGKIFKDPTEVRLAYENRIISLHTRIVLPAASLTGRDYQYKFKEKQMDKYLITTYGKIIFNTLFPRGGYFVVESELSNLKEGIADRFFLKKGSNIKNELKKWVSEGENEREKRRKNGKKINPKYILPHPFKKKFLKVIIAEVFKKYKLSETSVTLDRMKDLGFKYSTISGITISAADIKIVNTKKEALEKADEKVSKLLKQKNRGLCTEEERLKLVKEIWKNTRDKLGDDIKEDVLEHFVDNDLYLMSDSGARGDIKNFVQLSGMRGLMAKPNGEDMDIPIRSSFKEGLTMSEFFMSSHGSRKGSTDTALKTASSGYLTRRLVDVSQDATVTNEDCHTTKGIKVSAMILGDPNDPQPKAIPLRERILGRFLSKDVINPKNGKLVLSAGECVTEEKADEIDKLGIKEVFIRTTLTCDCPNGVCVKCYGNDLTTGEVVEKGEVVGIIAAQSIGEPGTQLTMRTFHSGGIAGGADITHGLPRVQELFEARPPKGQGVISEIDGKVIETKKEEKNRTLVTVRNPITNEVKQYETDAGQEANVKPGDEVKAGQLISGNLIHPKELLRVATVNDVANYILIETQKVYSLQGVDINDKHIEIIIKQMLQKVLIVNEGDTDLLPGSHVSKNEILKIIKQCNKEKKRIPVIKPVLLGITRASLKADSFLSAASFQETTRVLTETAIHGKKDRLEGLKENIIIGGLIPAGTGLVNEKEDMIEVEPDFDDDFDDEDEI